MIETTTAVIGNSKLYNHVNAGLVDWKDLPFIKTPGVTKTHVPIPHHKLVEEVKASLEGVNLTVKEEAYSVNKDGQKFFGLLGLNAANQNNDYQLVVGLRNSHDKSFPAGLVAGTRVFVCDNLAFSSEVTVTRKHTSRLMDDLPRLIATACGMINEANECQEQRVEHYQNFAIKDPQVHDLLIRSMKVSAIGSTAIPKVLGQWNDPKHEEFRPRTLWSLFNAYTEVYKAIKLDRLPRKTIALQGLLDTFSRFAPVTATDEEAKELLLNR